MIQEINNEFYLTGNLGEELKNIVKQKKEIDKLLEDIKNDIMIEMKKRNILSIKDESNGIVISYIGENEREKFNATKFKKENPDLYDEYIELAKIKESLRIKT